MKSTLHVRARFIRPNTSSFATLTFKETVSDIFVEREEEQTKLLQNELTEAYEKEFIDWNVYSISMTIYKATKK